MRLLVMSDTHGNYPLALKACQEAPPFDVIIHLGDGAEDIDILADGQNERLICVAGNCDHGSTAPRELIWEEGGKRLLLVHGDTYRVKSGLERLERRARELGVDGVLFGHTHCATSILREERLYLNPGTLMSSANPTTYAIVDVTPDGIHADLKTISL